MYFNQYTTSCVQSTFKVKRSSVEPNKMVRYLGFVVNRLQASVITNIHLVYIELSTFTRLKAHSGHIFFHSTHV